MKPETTEGESALPPAPPHGDALVHPPYGKSRIGRVRSAAGETDAQAIDVRREAQLAGRYAESYQGVPPVKKAPWEWYIPLYFWVGGLASGSWFAAAVEELAGENDRAVVRAGRYTALASTLAGTAMLITDLGRPERFHHMLRVMRPTSAMSIGSWSLLGFGAAAGAGAALQAAEDGAFGDRPGLAGMSRGALGRALHLLGIPAALFVGGYTGALLTSTSTPAWAIRASTLAPLFLVSSASNGLAIVAAIAEATGGASDAARLRLARAEAVALGAELALLAADDMAPPLPSDRDRSRAVSAARLLTVGAGVALPLALTIAKAARQPPRSQGPARGRDATRRRRPHGGAAANGPRRSGSTILSAALTLAGGLVLRFLTVGAGYRSADTPHDTWAFARGRGRAAAGAAAFDAGTTDAATAGAAAEAPPATAAGPVAPSATSAGPVASTPTSTAPLAPSAHPDAARRGAGPGPGAGDA